MVGRGRLLVVNITVGDSGGATWVHHCIRTSAMTRCVFRRIIFFHELGRPFFLLLRFFPFFLSLFAFFFFWNATAYFAQFAIRGYAPVTTPATIFNFVIITPPTTSPLPDSPTAAIQSLEWLPASDTRVSWLFLPRGEARCSGTSFRWPSMTERN